jgi:hypothetical protein
LDKRPARHEKYKSDSHDQQLQAQKKSLRVPAYIALCTAAVAGIVVVYFLFLCPEAQFKRAFKAAAAAFEQKKNDELSKFISDSYSDEGGNTKSSLLAASAALFASYDKLRVKIKRLDVKIVAGGKAELTIEGSVYFKTGDAMYRYKTEKPVILYMAKEPDGHKRLSSIQGLTFSLQSVANDLDDLK